MEKRTIETYIFSPQNSMSNNYPIRCVLKLLNLNCMYHFSIKLIAISYQGDEKFSQDQIREYFKRFGDIKLIEILSSNEPEACVTFVSDLSAFNMLSQHEKDEKMKNKFEITIATSAMLTLIDDCLRTLFEYLDPDSIVNMGDVCKRLNDLSKAEYKLVRKYEVKEKSGVTPAAVRRVLRRMGSNLTELSYTAHTNERTLTFLRLFKDNIQQNLRDAYFDFGAMESNPIQMIKPILRNLETLTIINDTGEQWENTNFQSLCPNLNKLKLNANMQLIVCSKQ